MAELNFPKPIYRSCRKKVLFVIFFVRLNLFYVIPAYSLVTCQTKTDYKRKRHVVMHVIQSVYTK